MAKVLAAQVSYAAGLFRLATGRVPARALGFAPDSLVVPDTSFAREAEDAWAEQPSWVQAHALRTWVLGSALAHLDRVGPSELDPELFYVASLLHDWGLDTPVVGQDFVLRASARARSAADEAEVDPDRTRLLADGICVHTTPGVDAGADGALGAYVQAGAMADIIGLRRGEVSRPARTRAAAAAPPGADFRDLIADAFAAEAAAVPEGRFAVLVGLGAVPLIRHAPRLR